MTDAVPQAIAELEIDDERYHRCETCHTTIDIPLDLYLRLDSGIFRNGREVQLVDLNEDWWVGVYWCLLGRLAKAICVDWCVSIKFESMGDDREFEKSVIVTTAESPQSGSRRVTLASTRARSACSRRVRLGSHRLRM